MRRTVIRMVGVSWAAMVGCGEPADDGAASGTSSESSSASASTGGSSSAGATSNATSATATTTVSTTTAADDTTTAEPTTATTDADESTTDTDPTGSPDANGCPGNAPASWISCENFDAIDDAPNQIAQWDEMGDGFGVEPDGDDPTDLALRITLQPSMVFGGWVSLRWGNGPDGPGVDSPGEDFDEVWVRYSLRTDDDWPGYEIGDVGEIIAANGPNWAIATETAIRGDAAGRLRPLGWTCIFDGALACNGSNDWNGALQLIWQEQGPSTIFGADSAGQTRCLEAHMRLNTPGASDGEAHVWIDGVEEIATTGVDFRGTWTDYGLNALRFTNYINPPPSPLNFWVDDVVVATERIGCD
ncbi:MAG: hypothetical protein JNK45_01480 [Myxococcales bacterium]|nr:hypothetical protein [Myxococcales bacterium]